MPQKVLVPLPPRLEDSMKFAAECTAKKNDKPQYMQLIETKGDRYEKQRADPRSRSFKMNPSREPIKCKRHGNEKVLKAPKERSVENEKKRSERPH